MATVNGMPGCIALSLPTSHEAALAQCQTSLCWKSSYSADKEYYCPPRQTQAPACSPGNSLSHRDKLLVI